MCLSPAIVDEQDADLERELEALEREIRAAQERQASGIALPGGHGAAIEHMARLSERRDRLAVELEAHRAAMAREHLTDIVESAPARIAELERGADKLAAKCGDAERVIASAEKQLTHYMSELSRALKSDDNDSARRAQSEISLHQARAENARQQLESIEAERQTLEGEIARHKAAQAISDELQSHASAAARLSALNSAAVVAERLTRAAITAGRECAADARNDLANAAARIRSLGAQAGLDAGLLLEHGLDHEPSPGAVAETLRAIYGLCETESSAHLWPATG